jgi:hypothetical protein
MNRLEKKLRLSIYDIHQHLFVAHVLWCYRRVGPYRENLGCDCIFCCCAMSLFLFCSIAWRRFVVGVVYEGGRTTTMSFCLLYSFFHVLFC